MSLNQRRPLRKFEKDIRRWVSEGRSDDWISSALGTTASSVQSFRSRHGIYRRDHKPVPEFAGDFSAYEGVLEHGERNGVWFDPAVSDDTRWRTWERTGRVEIRFSSERIVIIPRGV
jgi:hypothetical protein